MKKKDIIKQLENLNLKLQKLQLELEDLRKQPQQVHHYHYDQVSPLVPPFNPSSPFINPPFDPYNPVIYCNGISAGSENNSTVMIDSPWRVERFIVPIGKN